MTETYKKRKTLFFILSMICWMGLCGFLVTYGVCKGFEVTDDAQSIGSQLADIFVPMAMSYIIALVLFIFVKEKLRNTVWMVNMILSGAILGTTMLYISIALFAFDEFVFLPLYKYNKNKYSINKEIDKRL